MKIKLHLHADSATAIYSYSWIIRPRNNRLYTKMLLELFMSSANNSMFSARHKNSTAESEIVFEKNDTNQ